MIYKTLLKVEAEIICNTEAESALEAREKILRDLDDGVLDKRLIDNMQMVETRLIEDGEK